MSLQAPFDVPEANAGAAASFEGIGRRAGACVLHDERKAPRVVAKAIDSAANDDLSANLLLRNAMLDRVFHDRLEHQGRETNVPNPRRHINGDAQPLLKSGTLDFQIRLHDLELAAEAYIKWWKKTSPGGYEAFSKRVRG